MSLDDTYWVGLEIMKVLQEKVPSLDLSRADNRLLTICCEDFHYHMKFIRDNFTQVDSSRPLGMDLEVRMDIYTGVFEAIVTNDGGVNVEEIRAFVASWVGLWLKKYKQRVKLIFKPIKKPKCLICGAKTAKVKFTDAEIDDIIGETINALIKNGEICCSRILADVLFKKVVGQYTKKEWTIEDKLDLVSKLKREARRVARTSGVLVFMRLDKNYYKLREYRDDNAPKPF